jgi:hypothetical protein
MDLWLMQPWIQTIRRQHGDGIQDIEDVSGFFGELDQPPELLVQAIRAAAGDPSTRAYLNARGRDLARAAALQIPGIRPAPKGPPSPPNPWVAGVVSPVLDPLTDGFLAEAKLQAKPLILKATGLLAGIGLLGFVLGRLTKR